MISVKMATIISHILKLNIFLQLLSCVIGPCPDMPPMADVQYNPRAIFFPRAIYYEDRIPELICSTITVDGHLVQYSRETSPHTLGVQAMEAVFVYFHDDWIAYSQCKIVPIVMVPQLSVMIASRKEKVAEEEILQEIKFFNESIVLHPSTASLRFEIFAEECDGRNISYLSKPPPADVNYDSPAVIYFLGLTVITGLIVRVFNTFFYSKT